MAVTRQALKFIAWLRQHKGPVVLAIVVLELLIGLVDYWVIEEVPITELHYLTISLATIIYGWAGVVGISLAATASFYLATYMGTAKPLERLAIPSVTLTFLIFLLVGASVVLILRLMNSLQESNVALSDKVSQLEASRARIEILTSERERLRMARELHDGVAKTLIGIEYSAAALAQSLPPENTAARAKAQFIEKICHDEGQQLRGVILDLRQGYKEPLFEAVTLYLKRWKVAYNCQARLTTHGSDANLEPGQVYELMAIVEEALENIQQHSQASRVWVELEITPPLRLEIRDNGRGLPAQVLQHFQAESRKAEQASYTVPPLRGQDGRLRFGLTGMVERAEWLSGTLTLSQAPEGGLRLEVIIPLNAQVAAPKSVTTQG